jgi:hypothetical protein
MLCRFVVDEAESELGILDLIQVSLPIIAMTPILDIHSRLYSSCRSIFTESHPGLRLTY